MKIALVDPSLFTLPYDAALADGLRAHGHEVRLYTKHLAAGEAGKGHAGVVELFYPGLHHQALRRLPRPIFLTLKGVAHFFSHLLLLLALRQWKPDAIHFQWVPLPVLDRLFIPLYRRLAPTILTVHDSSPFNNNPSARLQRVGVFGIMNLFDRLIVHTEQARRVLVGHGVNEATMARIEHGVLSVRSIATTAPALTPDARAVNLLLFGKLKPYKGADILLRAIALLPAASRSKCRLRIVGKAEMDTTPLYTLAQELKIEPQVDWLLRFVSDEEKADIYARADIMVMPYRDIDASGVMMEAFDVGRPIVASRIGLFRELLEDGTHGLLVPQNDPAALAAALDRLINNPQLRLSMGAAVRALARSIPDWKVIGEKTVALYLAAGAKG